ncbi:3-oxo-Delta(4,5)-steroid 5-beta-reductase [Senna tora]|uniref:3-oxo-Delta(4,5)-steroid 5-beta-reductase n=1 Tax=Senna tora TaxID=362788 RepID=A0A834SNC8_9FABA|nr:3-oxo-Delta(4,5)-steroid 5-beta-reductase [Senna tora]
MLPRVSIPRVPPRHPFVAANYGVSRQHQHHADFTPGSRVDYDGGAVYGVCDGGRVGGDEILQRVVEVREWNATFHQAQCGTERKKRQMSNMPLARFCHTRTPESSVSLEEITGSRAPSRGESDVGGNNRKQSSVSPSSRRFVAIHSQNMSSSVFPDSPLLAS